MPESVYDTQRWKGEHNLKVRGSGYNPNNLKVRRYAHRAQRAWTAGASLGTNVPGFGLYKIFVYFGAIVHESTILSFPPPTCIGHTVAMLLHDYWAV